MKFWYLKSWRKSYLLIASLCCVCLLLASIPVKLSIAHYQSPYPQAILTLGGSPDREAFTAKFAQIVPPLPIWVSTGMSKAQARKVFRRAGIADRLVHLDYRAVDTVTNFTSLVKDFQQTHIQHIYLITSSFHMSRAVAIATIVLGSHGITFTPIPVPSKQTSEPKLEIVRDSLRAVFWLFTGHTGASFKKSPK